MKTKLTWLLPLFLLAFCGKVHAQQPCQQDCLTAIPVCNSFYSQANAYSGTGADATELTTLNQGCLGSGEKNDVWYVINVTSPGILAFNITPNNPNDDYDFGLWDITGVGCQALFNYNTNTANAYPPVRCNYYPGYPAGLGMTGISNTITYPTYDVGLNVVAGQTLVLNVSNFSSSQSGYTLDFGPSTASIYDTVKPTLGSITTQCQFPSNTLRINMSEPIKCSSLTSTGSEFYITPAVSGVSVIGASGLNCVAVCSATNSIDVTFSAQVPPGNYFMHVQNGTDSNTLSDNCGNYISTTDSIPFTIVSPNPPQMVSVDDPACIKARIHFDKAFKCNSVAADGSNFVINGPGAVAVQKAIVIGCDKNLSSTIDVYFTQSIITPGVYNISVKPGSNNISIADTCNGMVANNINFTVSDQGYVTAAATPNILCYPGYVQLNAAATVGGPASPVSCGINGSGCGGVSADYAVGSASTAAGTTINTPFSGANLNGRTQILFTAKQLLNAGLTNGTITKVGLTVTSKASTAPYMLSVKMSCTNDTALTAFKNNLPIVYNSKAYSTTVGVNSLPLDNPYDWDGISNLILEICFTGGGTGDDAVLTTTGTRANQVMHNAINSSIDGCALATTNTLNNNTHPNTIFTECNRPAGPISYAWQPGTFTQDSTAASTLAYAPYSRDFIIRIMDSSFCYRRAPAGVYVSVRHPLLFSHDTAVCVGLNAYLHAGGGTHYEWIPSDGLSCVNCSDPVLTPTLPSATYSVIIFDSVDCADTLSEDIIVNQLPFVYAGRDTTVNYGTPLQLYVTAPAGRYYRWDPATWINVDNIANPIVTPQITTNYVVHVIDTNQCENTDTVLITVRQDVPVFVPSGFTPNNDGNNDKFRVSNLTFQKIEEFRVFNRWGQEVFNATNNDGWDGRFNGVPQDMGTYSYLIKVGFPDGKSQVFKGDVTLIR